MGIAGSLRKIFRKPYASVAPAAVGALLDAGAVLVDVREPDEWRAGHAPKARHIPLGQLPGRAKELPVGRPLVTVCRSGARSARAATMLAADGFEVHNVTGGMRAWAAAGLPVAAKGGRPGRIT
ncbi:rhodanese-like domain-containing protein [Mangrovihabitans endophyticus]|uniref:Rhodanese domain-containing protein n=1 Tax=Mangrovihabitans endophyticus TaxID=1751298 RepID=A0A8J3FRX1_9ACTN|nr:rhodanese-like domain-containing protein [Mangrovihabitans endophyticus]GGL10348.1 hypothetical protein GCM10012284_51400 [Mangrovihabitans endophyticus]